MKAIILARVSTEEQKVEGQSIPAQLARAREYAIKKNLQIVSEHQFDESSTKDKRRKFEEVVNEIKKSKELVALIVETVDRLQRSFKESVMFDELRKNGQVELHFIRENLIIHKDSNSSEIQRWDLAVFTAKSFVLQVSDNVKRTFERKIRNGEILRKSPIGYINSVDSHGNKAAIPDPNTAHLIQMIFNTYAAGNVSMETLGEIATAKGLVGPRAHKAIRTRKIEEILKNPFYYGFQRYKGQLWPHKYEPLISERLFRQCEQARLAHHHTPAKFRSKTFVLNKGLIKCADPRCGCAITAEIHKGRFIYYKCTNYRKVHEKNVLVRENDLLEPIREVLRNISLKQEDIDKLVADLKKTESAKNEFYENQLESIRQKYDTIQRRISVMYTDRLDGRITTDEYDDKIKAFKEEQANLQFEMRKYEHADKNYYITANQVLSLAKRAAAIFDALDSTKSSEVEKKRNILNFVLSNCRLEGKKLLFDLKTPFNSIFSYNTKTLPLEKASLWGALRELNPY